MKVDLKCHLRTIIYLKMPSSAIIDKCHEGSLVVQIWPEGQIYLKMPSAHKSPPENATPVRQNLPSAATGDKMPVACSGGADLAWRPDLRNNAICTSKSTSKCHLCTKIYLKMPSIPIEVLLDKNALFQVACLLPANVLVSWRHDGSEKNCLHFSICACHPCAGAMLIFSVSFQV